MVQQLVQDMLTQCHPVEESEEVELDAVDRLSFNQAHFYVKTDGSRSSYDYRYHCSAEEDDNVLACGRVSIADCTDVGSFLPDASVLCKHCARARGTRLCIVSWLQRLSCCRGSSGNLFLIFNFFSFSAQFKPLFIRPSHPRSIAQSMPMTRRQICRCDKCSAVSVFIKIFVAWLLILGCSRSRPSPCWVTTSRWSRPH